MSVAIFLAEVATPWWETGAGLVIAVLGGAAIVTTLLAGYWVRNVSPLIREEIAKWYLEQLQKEARQKEIAEQTKTWFDDKLQREARKDEIQLVLRTPAVVEEQEKHVKRIIENEIMRTDGLIRKEIATQVSSMEARLMEKLDEVAIFLKEDREFQQQMIQRMSKFEGAIMAVLAPHKLGSTTGEHAPLPPAPKPR